jgi:hypothetical protein
MAGVKIEESDLVVVRLTLRARDRVADLELNETLRVSDLGLRRVAGAVKAPVLDGHKYAQLIMDDPGEATRVMAAFTKAVADYQAVGGRTPAESLAEGIVDYFVAKRPGGHTITKDSASATGYILNTREMNITGPHEMGDVRCFRATAVGTWGLHQ